MAQKVTQWQAVMQLAQNSPQIYDLPELHKQMLEVLGVRNIGKIIPTAEDQKPKDPVTENMDILAGKPAKAFMHQDHEAHIAVHMAMGQDPKIAELMQNNPQAQIIMASGMAHVTEHVGFLYRKQIEEQLGVSLPPPDEPLPPDVEVQLSKLVAQAAAQLSQKNMAEAQQAQQQQEQQDPLNVIQREELELKKQELQLKAQGQQADIEIQKAKLMIDAGKLDSQQALKDKEQMFKEKQLSAQQMQDGARFGMEVADKHLNRQHQTAQKAQDRAHQTAQSAQQQAQKPEKESK